MRHLEIFTGRVGVIEELREFTNGCVLSFTVAETPRVKKGNEWVDAPTIWTKVTVFGDEAKNVQRSIKPGTFVTVFGERRASEYIVKDTNEKRISQAVIAEQVAISITKFAFVESMGNINYAKDSTPTISSASGPASAPSTQAKPAAKAAEDPFADGGMDDPFGNDDDPFGLNS